MTTKATFCQLPTTYCFHCQPCSCNTLRLCLLSSLKLRQTKHTTVDSCDGGISVLNHCLSWSKFVNNHLYHSRQWFNIHLTCYRTRYPSYGLFHDMNGLTLRPSLKFTVPEMTYNVFSGTLNPTRFPQIQIGIIGAMMIVWG